MEKRFEQIIRQGRAAGKTAEEINLELKTAGAGFHLEPDGRISGWTETEMAEGFVPAAEEPADAQRTVDMRRRPEFAGTVQLQHIPGGTYEVTYNGMGQAVKAVKVHG